MRRRRVGLIGVPSSAGAHWPGQEKAPGVLRGAGLVERLESAGCAVVDHGDLPRFRFRPDSGHPQNLAAVIEVARSVAERVEGALGDGEIPLVIGGDCTIELGVLCGFLRAGEDPALLYLDGGLDLRTPTDNPTGILDSMGGGARDRGTRGRRRTIPYRSALPVDARRPGRVLRVRAGGWRVL